jgi:hypothetical protein
VGVQAFLASRVRIVRLKKRVDSVRQLAFGYWLLDESDSLIQTAVMHDAVAGVADHEQYFKARTLFKSNSRELPSIQARHQDVCEKEINFLASILNDLQGSIRSIRLEDTNSSALRAYL